MPSDSPVTPDRITELVWGYAPPLILEAAIKLNIFDLLNRGCKSVSQIQQATGASARGLTVILNALVGLRLLEQDDKDHFSLVPESATFLVSTNPEFQGGLIRRLSTGVIPRWLRLAEVVVTGRPNRAVNEQDSGVQFFQEFVRDLFPVNYPAARVLAQALEMRSKEEFRVLDLAAGSGVWGIAVAMESENVRVTAIDWPNVVDITQETVTRFGLGDRFSYVEGDLLEAEFNTGYDLAILGHILHSEGDERSRALIAKASGALRAGGTIAIAEYLVNNDRTGPLSSLLFAVNMLLSTNEGNTYSFEEIGEWLREAHFVDARKLEAPGPSPLILATKSASGS